MYVRSLWSLWHFARSEIWNVFDIAKVTWYRDVYRCPNLFIIDINYADVAK